LTFQVSDHQLNGLLTFSSKFSNNQFGESIVLCGDLKILLKKRNEKD
jgi:hypothetical protein